jgi:hypothetical protein
MYAPPTLFPLLLLNGVLMVSLDRRCWCKFIDGWPTPGIKPPRKGNPNYRTPWPSTDVTRSHPLLLQQSSYGIGSWTVRVLVQRD